MAKLWVSVILRNPKKTTDAYFSLRGKLAVRFALLFENCPLKLNHSVYHLFFLCDMEVVNIMSCGFGMSAEAPTQSGSHFASAR